MHCGRFVDVVKGEVRDECHVGSGRRPHQPTFETGSSGSVPDDGLDLSGCTVAPGLIDLHTHLAGDEESGSYGDILMSSQADDALIGVKNARSTIDAGFTSVRDVGSFRAFTDVSLAEGHRQLDGSSAHVCSAPVATSPCTGGGGEVTGFAADVHVPETMQVGVAESRDEVRKAVRRYMAGGADFIKVIATGAVLAPGTNSRGLRIQRRRRSAPLLKKQRCTELSLPHTLTARRESNAPRVQGFVRSSTAHSPTTKRCG